MAEEKARKTKNSLSNGNLKNGAKPAATPTENRAKNSPPQSSNRRRSDEKRRRRSSRDQVQSTGTEQMEVVRYRDASKERRKSSTTRNSVIKWKKVSGDKVGGDEEVVVGGGKERRPSGAKTDKLTRKNSSANRRSRANSLYDNLNDHLPSYHEMLKINDESEDIFEVNFQKAVEQVGIQVVPPLSPLVVRPHDYHRHQGDFLKKSRSVDDTLDGGRKRLPPVEDPWKLKERRGSGHLNKFPVTISGKSPNKNHIRRSSNEQSSSLARVKRKSLQSQEKLN